MKLYMFFLTALILTLASTAQAQVAVIVNKSVPEGSLTISKVNDIYSLREKKWSNGSAIVLVAFKSDNDATQKFFGALGTSSMEMKKAWMKAQLTGEGHPPEAVGSTEEILEKVASTPGAIGFVDASKVSGKVKAVLTIN